MRDEAIRRAIEDGVSDRALAIVARVNMPRISQIARGVSYGNGAPAPLAIGVHAVNAKYPCCHVGVRFHADEAMDPGATLVKYCPRCKTPWIVSRSILASTDRGRVDELHWTTSA